MSQLFKSILVPLDGSSIAARSLGCAGWLADRLDAKLHVLGAAAGELPAGEALERLGVPEAYRKRVTLHQASDHPSEAILAALARYGAQLVVMAAQGQSAEASAGTPGDADRSADGLVGHVARAVIERSMVPVLLLPPRYRESLPWERALVPVSGEVEGDEALALAAQLGDALALEVHVAHVLDPHAGDASLAANARYADAMHHEYPRRLQELVSRAFPQCSGRACRIADVALCQGDVAAALLEQIERKGVSLLVAGWHGSYVSGHADVLKRLLPEINIPVLLVKATVRAPFRLAVGAEIE